MFPPPTSQRPLTNKERKHKMPWVKVDLSAGRTVDQKQKTAAAITNALVEHCGCSPESVSIVFSDVSADNWAFSGRLLSQVNEADT
ncbi:tautomerase family protein [Agrobacterium tumefaciens]|uniref:tautomerase family protein n=2 Tax=Agrobacterium tumefaciens complex TaxID=1183400 RepID=UPI002B1BD789|nr:tautomerase family protein [Agrobacterium tumefaciens]